jgi:hypothetical protein
MKYLDVDHPFFLPRWRRIAVVVFCVAWAGFEWVTQSHFWAILATAMAAYAAWALLFAFDPARASRGPRSRE